MIGIVTGCNTQINYENWLSENSIAYRLVDSDTDLEGIRAMVFCGGPDWGENQARDLRERTVFGKCLAEHIPIFGVCRGMQVVSHLLGAQLIQNLGDLNGVHRTMPDNSSRWHYIVLCDGRRWRVNSRHHQAVEGIPFECSLTARAEDGTLELLQSADDMFLLVQSHPEMPEMRGTEIEKHCIRWLKQHST